MNVIALYADAMQSGKSTVAMLLEPHGYRKVAIAAPLKAMLEDLLKRSGYTHRFIYEALYGECKNVPLSKLGGVTARTMMQRLGTEWGRNLSHDLWLAALGTSIRRMHEAGFHVVIDDTRFVNEMDYLKNQWKAVVVKVDRPGVVDTSGHASEGELKDYVPDAVILNDRGPDAFRAHLVEQIADLVGVRHHGIET